MKRLGSLGAALLVGVVAGAILVWQWRPDPEVIYQRVEVPVEVIVEREPEVEVRFVERLKVITPPPVQVAIAPGGAAAQVSSFCMPSTLTAQADSTTERPAPELLLRSVVHSPGWWLQRDRLLLTGPTSYGDLVALDFNVRPGFSARAVGDSVLVRYPRLGLGRQAVELGFPLLLGLFVGWKVLP